MITSILAIISGLILTIIEKIGYFGIFILMTLQSYNIPIPSEIIMPFSGFLASSGKLGFWPVVIIGTLGNLSGAYLSYATARYLLKNGFRKKFMFLENLMSERHLEIAENWFKRFGSISVFFGRMTPIVGTFISFPAGLSKMNIFKFLSFTFLGSLIWSYILTRIGFILGENWGSLEHYFRQFDYVILALIIAAIFLKIYNHRKRK